MDLAFRSKILHAGYSPTDVGKTADDLMRDLFGFSHKYESARLCLGLSLALSDALRLLPESEAPGIAIKGETLFGEETADVWICLLLTSGNFTTNSTEANFKQMVEAHWHRGATRFLEMWKESSSNKAKLLKQIAVHLPRSSNKKILSFSESGNTRISSGPLAVKIGEISKRFSNDEEINVSLNAQGVSPNIALMGKMGSGKTRTGVEIAQQIAQNTEISVLIIDPKGEFCDGGQYGQRIKDNFLGIQSLIIGESPIPVDFLPPTGSDSISVQNAASRLRDSIALTCRAGPVQKDCLRDAVIRSVEDGTDRSLGTIKSLYEQALIASGKSSDGVMSRLNEVTQMECFLPTLDMGTFFGQSWVVSLHRIQSEEIRSLIMLLLLDAFASYTLSQPDAPLDSKGFRGIRNLLFIDEARKILAHPKYESLVDIVRQGRSKGIITMLVSQDPSDFQGQTDDFLSQLGTVVAFACNQSNRGLSNLGSVYGRKLQPNEFADTWLEPGIAFAKLPNIKADRIRCWEPRSS